MNIKALFCPVEIYPSHVNLLDSNNKIIVAPPAKLMEEAVKNKQLERLARFFQKYNPTS